MASPQKENGYTPIANELLEKIYGGVFTASELRIMLTVLRFTYGFSRKTHKMSRSFIAKATGLNARETARVLKDLVRKNVILETAKNSYTESREIGLNKNMMHGVCTQEGIPLTVHSVPPRGVGMYRQGGRRYVPHSTVR